eukprot:scaffold235276_cov33-Tisochrysis_lutea.AAC.2
MTTCVHVFASAGTIDMAVAPEPTTTTRLCASLKCVTPRKVWLVRLVKVIVASAPNDEPAANDDSALAAHLNGERPSALARAPRLGEHAMVVPDLSLEPVLGCNARNVLPNLSSISQVDMRVEPGEGVGERGHRRVGAHPRISKQVPRAAKPCPGLDEAEREVRAA